MLSGTLGATTLGGLALGGLDIAAGPSQMVAAVTQTDRLVIGVGA